MKKELYERMKERIVERDYFLKNFDRLIRNSDSIVLFAHKNPDGDALGSMYGLKLVLQKQYPNKDFFIICENQKLFPFLIMKNDVLPHNFVYEHAMAIVLDCGQSDRIQGFDEYLGNPVHRFGTVVKIDHHESYPDFEIDLSWDDGSYAAVCCQLVQVCDYYGWKITKEAATFFYLGICTDSGRFLFESALPRTLILAAKTWRAGADYRKLHTQLNKRTFKEIKLQRHILEKCNKGQGVLWYYISSKEQIEFGLDSYKNFVNTLSNIENYEIWIMCRDNDEGTISCEIRSLDIAIHRLASEFGGGGHPRAAGCNLTGTGAIQELVLKAEALVSKHQQKNSLLTKDNMYNMEEIKKDTQALLALSKEDDETGQSDPSKIVQVPSGHLFSSSEEKEKKDEPKNEPKPKTKEEPKEEIKPKAKDKPAPTPDKDPVPSSKKVVTTSENSTQKKPSSPTTPKNKTTKPKPKTKKPTK